MENYYEEYGIEKPLTAAPFIHNGRWMARCPVCDLWVEVAYRPYVFCTRCGRLFYVKGERK